MESPDSSKDVSYPSSFELVDTQNAANKRKGGNEIKIGLHFRQPVKDYFSQFFLKNADLTDVRLYELKITVLPKPLTAVLEFETSAGLPITQEIPVSNPTGSEVTFVIEKEDFDGGEAYEIPKTVTIEPNTDGFVPVIFKPEWIGKCFAEITITNPRTAEKFIYKMKGLALDPLSEDHISVVAKLGECYTHRIRISPKKSQEVIYNVEYDMHGLSGPS